MHTEDKHKLLDDMVEIAEACGYEVPAGIDESQLIKAVAEMLEKDQEIEAEARTFFTEAIDFLAEASEDSDEDDSEEDEDEPKEKKAEKKDGESKEEKAEKDSDEKDESVESHFFMNESGEISVSEEMATLMDQMVDLIENSGYDVEAGLGPSAFLEAVEDFLGETTEMEEAKSSWLKRSHAAAIGELGKMHKVGAAKTHIKAFTKPHHAKK